MTENKRFSVKRRQGATIYSIIDYYGELPLSEGMYYKSNAEKLYKWLNTQHELLNAFCKENEQLKKQLESKEKAHIRCDKLYQKLYDENEELKSTIKEVTELLSEEVDLFSDKATEHDINAYVELKELDNKDAFYMATATKKAIRMLNGLIE